jgi:hypothetical protein
MHKAIVAVFVVAFALGCARQDQLPNKALPLEPEKMLHFAAYTEMQKSDVSRADPKYEEWPSLVGQRLEFTGKPVRDWVNRTPRISVREGIELQLAGDFTENSLASDAIRVSGILERRLCRKNATVWEEFVLVVEEWRIVDERKL